MKIFLTVGTQLGFDRLVKAVDLWAKDNPRIDFFAQIGAGSYTPNNMSFTQYLTDDEYNKIFSLSDVIVSHAGMGTIISSRLNSKPIIIMPRDQMLGEHRNSHQMATCERFKDLDGCYIAKNETSVQDFLSDCLSLSSAQPLEKAEELQNNLENVLKCWFRACE